MEEADNKISVLHTENSELKAEKKAIKAELDRNFDETLELLNQSFFQVVRQAHVLYNGPPPSDDFDSENKVFECQILSRAEVKALESAAQPASTEGAEGEDQEVLGFSFFLFPSVKMWPFIALPSRSGCGLLHAFLINEMVVALYIVA